MAIEDTLAQIDKATNALAENQQVISDTEQEISDDIDKLLAGVKPGTSLTPDQVAQLQANADRLQAASDANQKSVDTLKAIASKGAANPVPVPVPPTPVV